MSAIERVAELEDRIRVHLDFHNGVSIADQAITVDVLYADIPALPPPPLAQTPLGYAADCWSEQVLVNKLKKTIEFWFEEFQENTSSWMQMLKG